MKLFTTFGKQKEDIDRILLEVSHHKLICKNAVSKGWCKESR